MNIQLVVLLISTVFICTLCSCAGISGNNDLANEEITKEQVEMMLLREKLADTAWTWPEADWPKSKAWFLLKADGTARAGWHSRACLWTVTSGSSIKMIMTYNPPRGVLDLVFNSDVTEGTAPKTGDGWREILRGTVVSRKIEPEVLEEYLEEKRSLDRFP